MPSQALRGTPAKVSGLISDVLANGEAVLDDFNILAAALRANRTRQPPARRVDVRVPTNNERRAFGLRHAGDRGFAYVMRITAVGMLAPRD